MAKEFSVNKNGLSDQCVTDGMEKCTSASKNCVGASKQAMCAYNIVDRPKYGKQKRKKGENYGFRVLFLL